MQTGQVQVVRTQLKKPHKGMECVVGYTIIFHGGWDEDSKQKVFAYY